MGVCDEEKYNRVYESLFCLWQMKVAGEYVSEKPVTVGDVRSLSVHQVSLIDGLDRKGLFGCAIVRKLFGIRNDTPDFVSS